MTNPTATRPMNNPARMLIYFPLSLVYLRALCGFAFSQQMEMQKQHGEKDKRSTRSTQHHPHRPFAQGSCLLLTGLRGNKKRFLVVSLANQVAIVPVLRIRVFRAASSNAVLLARYDQIFAQAVSSCGALNAKIREFLRKLIRVCHLTEVRDRLLPLQFFFRICERRSPGYELLDQVHWWWTPMRQ